MSDVLTAVKNFFNLFKKVPEGDYATGERRFAVEDFDKRLKQVGVELKDGGSRKRVTIMEISDNK